MRIVTTPGEISVFKAVPELLRRRPGTSSNHVFHDVDDIIPELADQVISLDGDLGHSFMAFKMGTSAAAGGVSDTFKTSMMQRLKMLQQQKAVEAAAAGSQDPFEMNMFRESGGLLQPTLRESRNPSEMTLPQEMPPTTTPFTVKPTKTTMPKFLGATSSR